MKEDSLSKVFHDLRAPIAGIRGYLDMILDGSFGELPPDAADKLRLVSGQAKYLHEFVENFYIFSLINQGKISPRLKPVSVKSVIEGSFLAFDRVAGAKGLRLDFEIAAGLPPILADESWLKQALSCLTNNAIKYTDRGVISLRVVPSGRGVEISISDTGLGIPAAELKKVFRKFYRGRGEKTDKIKGAGLGLWIAGRLIKMMGGKIRVDSRENKGTRATVIIPSAKPKK